MALVRGSSNERGPDYLQYGKWVHLHFSCIFNKASTEGLNKHDAITLGRKYHLICENHNAEYCMDINNDSVEKKVLFFHTIY